jgi:hypothetical protein
VIFKSINDNGLCSIAAALVTASSDYAASTEIPRLEAQDSAEVLFHVSGAV